MPNLGIGFHIDELIAAQFDDSFLFNKIFL